MALGYLGRDDEAIDSLQRCINMRAGMCAFMNIDPNLESLHDHPRFAALVDQIGIGR